MPVIITNGKVRKTKRKNSRRCEMCGKPFGPNVESYRMVLKHKLADGTELIESPSIRVCKECALPIWEHLWGFTRG